MLGLGYVCGGACVCVCLRDTWIMQSCQHCLCTEFFRCLAQFKSQLWIIYNLLHFHAFVLNSVECSLHMLEKCIRKLSDWLSCSPWQPVFCILANVLWIQIQAVLWLHATYANTIKSEYQIGNNTQPNVELSNCLFSASSIWNASTQAFNSTGTCHMPCNLPNNWFTDQPDPTS